jgi:uncharacterized protein with GYD domain
MPVYISRGRFTPDAIKGMLNKPENREQAVTKLFQSVRGKLIGWYLTFGHHDWMAIGEFPNEKAAASAILAAAFPDAWRFSACHVPLGSRCEVNSPSLSSAVATSCAAAFL